MGVESEKDSGLISNQINHATKRMQQHEIERNETIEFVDLILAELTKVIPKVSSF